MRNFKSLTIPVDCISRVALKTPLFSSKSVTGTISPVPGGSLDGPGALCLTFKQGGAERFYQILNDLLTRNKGLLFRLSSQKMTNGGCSRSRAPRRSTASLLGDKHLQR